MRDQWGMSNVLKVSLQATIYSLHDRGWSRRRIARELGVDRETVSRYLLLAKPAISTTGFEGAGEAKPAISTAGKGVGRKSQCEPLAEVIVAKVEVGLSAQRIYQDLVEETGFTDSYQSVKRFVRKLRSIHPERIWRLECQPGEELQLDFGLGAPIAEGQCKRRRSWVLRLVLSYSRKGYSEAVTRQDTETFIRCLENGLRSLGGCPLLLNLDNMKAAVLKADWFDPEINPKLADFCRHYGMHVVPCRPSMPQHKGKVERGVAYLRDNALKGRRFKSLAEENLFLSYWESSVADKRIHGTDAQAGGCLF
jgi:transposase